MVSIDIRSRKKPLRILMVTGVYPTELKPHAGTFIKAQVDSLIAAGLEVEVIHPKPVPSPFAMLQQRCRFSLKR